MAISKKKARNGNTQPEDNERKKSDYAIKIVKKKLSELRHASYNPRKMTQKAFDGLNKSIKTFGYVDPIIINRRTGNIVGGHRRYDALISQSNGANTTVDVVEIDIDETQEKALNVTLNNHHIMGEFDSDKLQFLLEDIKFDLPEFEELQLNKLELKTSDISDNTPEGGLSEKTDNSCPDECPNCGFKLKVQIVKNRK